MNRYRSAFAMPSGFAVATRTAAKGTSSAQEPAAKIGKEPKATIGRVRQAPAASTTNRAA